MTSIARGALYPPMLYPGLKVYATNLITEQNNSMDPNTLFSKFSSQEVFSKLPAI